MGARTLIVALLGVIVLTAVGCGSGDGSQGDGTSLTFWTAEDNPDRVKAHPSDCRSLSAADQHHGQAGGDQRGPTLIPGRQRQRRPGPRRCARRRVARLCAHSLAADGIIDPDAATAVINTLGPETFSRRGLSLVEVNGKPAAVPSDSWTQLLVYRKDLFDQAGLAAPTTFEAIRTAAATSPVGVAGIVAATKAGDSFTQQTFEYLAVANNCQLVDQAGTITLASKPCVDTFNFYVDLIRTASVQGAQDATTTRPPTWRARRRWSSGRRFSSTSWLG